MRIDKDKSAKVWARRLRWLILQMESDGVQFAGHDDVVHVYKDDDHQSVRLVAE